ncbi:MAG TPA: GGDEF domain-containing protein [Candidatus Limnocylindria bacterium]
MTATDTADRIARIGARLAAVLLAPLAVGTLRLFPPLALDAQGVPGWLPTVLLAGATLALLAAAAASVGRGLASGVSGGFVAAAGFGSLGAGLAVAAIRSAGDPSAFPDGSLPASAVVAGAVLLLARTLPDRALDGRRARAGAVAGAFVVVEAALGLSLLLAPAADARPWLISVAAALIAAAAIPAWFSGGLLAGGLLALAASRVGSADGLAPVLAMAAGGIGAAWSALFDRAVAPAAAQIPVTDQPPSPPAMRPAEPLRVDAEAMRLARELRGTIGELLEARRTIELQRAELARVATTDPLTGVASRRQILERLRMEASEARRYSHPVAVVLLDIDGFAAVNQRHSLAVGDAVLRELALRLRLRMREADALGREGGDSFLAILPHTDERGAAVFADAVRRRLTARPVMTDAGEVGISVSIGVAFIRPGSSQTDEELLAAAAEALASARAAGGNRIAFDRAHGLVRLEERRGSSGRDEGSETA